MTRFRPLLTLGVAHAYYGAPCRALEFLLPPDTVRRLAGARMLAREREGTLHVLYEADEAGDPISRAVGATLRIGLRLADPNFSNVTVVAADFPRRKLAYANAGDAASLGAPTPFDFVAETFTHAVATAGRPVTVVLLDAGGIVLRSEVVEAGRAAASFDVRGVPAGRLRLEERAAGGTTTTTYYLDPELRRKHAVGVVEVAIGAGFYAAPPALVISFDARSDVLRYYVVARNYTESELGQLVVSDAGPATPAQPTIAFERVPADEFTPAELPAALVGGADARVVLFRSAGALPRRERGRPRIQLSKNGDVLIPNLQQPGADSPTADLIVHVSKP